jgi:hypothetical protein
MQFRTRFQPGGSRLLVSTLALALGSGCDSRTAPSADAANKADASDSGLGEALARGQDGATDANESSPGEASLDGGGQELGSCRGPGADSTRAPLCSFETFRPAGLPLAALRRASATLKLSGEELAAFGTQRVSTKDLRHLPQPPA